MSRIVNQLKQIDLADEIGRQSVVSEILNGNARSTRDKLRRWLRDLVYMLRRLYKLALGNLLILTTLIISSNRILAGARRDNPLVFAANRSISGRGDR